MTLVTADNTLATVAEMLGTNVELIP
jgi:hypothetical protein